MRLITRESDYGIAALVSLARRKGRGASASELAKGLRIPGAFLRRILQKLGRHGIVVSKKGIGGGFELAMDSRKILVADVVSALQGPIRISDCDVRKAICVGRNRCILRDKLKEIESRLIEELMSISISSLAG